MASPAYDVALINSLSDDQLIETLSTFSPSRRWGQELLKRRPFQTAERLLHAAADVWWNVCTREDWVESFNARPLIGDQASCQKDRWSAIEDALTIAAPKHIAEELIACNRPYRDKFGYVWVLCCEGLTPQQQLANYRRRVENDPETELRENCVEDFKVTLRRLRLCLLGQNPYAKKSCS
jgi:2-oxo-4-hydroxy-4-carboxy-5-ureidoimidazoline decarboxylase